MDIYSRQIDVLRVMEQLKIDEGYRARLYKCSAGVNTIGYGHNCEDADISKITASHILSSDVASTIADCERFDWFYPLDSIRKEVIINMVFNLGFNGVSKFKKMIAAIKEGEFETASDEMKDSRWYVQVGSRAERLCREMRTGKKGFEA